MRTLASPNHSVTVLINRLRSGNAAQYQDAAARLWARYMPDLLDLARQNLSKRVRRRVDEEDVVQSMYASFCARQRRGDFVLEDRGDLWNLMVQITENKARNAAKAQTRQRRDLRREQPEAAETNGGTPGPSPADLTADPKPTPGEAAVLVEELQRRLEALDATQRKVALWKLAGHTNEEIAAPDKLDCAVRTVERKLALIRQRWAEQADAAENTADDEPGPS